MRGMMVNRQVFGLSADGHLCLKLTADRAVALIAEGIGKSLSPFSRPVVEGWIRSTDPAADWVGLAKEAYRVAAAK